MFEALCAPGSGHANGACGTSSQRREKSMARESSTVFSRSIPSREPKNSRCAVPMPVKRPTSGCAMSHSAAISPGWFVPISRTRNSASSGQFRIVRGRPMWLLKLPSVPYVEPTFAKKAFKNSLVVVFPADPVTPITLALRELRLSRARACRASSPSITSAAPLASADGMKSRPSVFSPLSATKPMPGFTSRESRTYLMRRPYGSSCRTPRES